jgi:Ca2+-binding EF-hand superfamily protein
MNDFNVDKSEYHSVFKVFDKDNNGQINITTVFELINQLDDLGNKQSEEAPSKDKKKSPKKQQSTTMPS